MTIESTPRPFSEGLTKELDMEVKSSLLAMSVRFLKHGKRWTVQRFRCGDVEHILLSTHPVKSVNMYYADGKELELTP